MHRARRLASREDWIAARRNPARMLMIAMTTNNSTSVNATLDRRLVSVNRMPFPLRISTDIHETQPRSQPVADDGGNGDLQEFGFWMIRIDHDRCSPRTFVERNTNFKG